MPFGGVYEIYAKANKLEEQGKRIIHMEIGRPDFDSPDFAKEAVKLALDKSQVHYTDANGIETLRKAIVEKEERRFGLKYDYETEISIMCGAAEVIGVIMLTMMNPGDEIICPSPYFSAYKEQALISGVKLVEVPTLMSESWQLNVEKIRNKITSKTKMLLINSPNNPTGYILSEENLQQIANIAKEKDLIVLSDECYDEFIYGEKHISISTLEDMRDRTLIVKSASKSFSMTGWRIGYAAANEDIAKLMSNIQSHTTSNPCSISQYASVEGLVGDQSSVEYMKKHFAERRNVMVDMVNSIKGLSCRKPKGAFYVMVNFKNIKGKNIAGTKVESSLDFAKLLLDKVKVAVIPGIAFGNDDYIRLSYATSMENIKEGLRRIKQIVEEK